ncbi:hypothetical protein RSal33209_0447 [Renibacterium salmoninarum ATCC 33209]|uniref:Uncharacterized protein n=1 Tax=Renibacterium salmoninarum (strain ATCC 33209 / DSM 20767 / JCM 11484 / NBRC 15589 / NCIMB 2235) TaxID=288705 RepID=A9WM17_RENSM|nr:hypothetical protein RSal33209_0447 [Renibacterium salmoninarum ATCC 33209]
MPNPCFIGSWDSANPQEPPSLKKHIFPPDSHRTGQGLLHLEALRRLGS